MVDMHAPGVEVRPLRQITGEAEFNEVYLTDVRIADADRIGDIGEGWRVSMTTLMNERTTIGGASGWRWRQPAASAAIEEALDLWKKRAEHDAIRSTATASRKLWIDNEVLRYTNVARRGEGARREPRPGRIDREAALANVNKATYEFCIDLLGADGLVDYDYTFKRPDEAGLEAPLGSSRKMFLRARAELDRGRHVGDHAQHPRRTHARPARRTAHRPRPPVVASSPQLRSTRA